VVRNDTEQRKTAPTADVPAGVRRARSLASISTSTTRPPSAMFSRARTLTSIGSLDPTS
jgi:hypothetical protein